ncbi:MAG: hypothetical protein VX835_01410 [Pseudomonadota bacterium]|nr:hypothetical protein [Pseudomonadota bacterium]
MWKLLLLIFIQTCNAMPMIILQSNQEELKSLSQIIRSDLKSSKANYHAGKLQLLLKSKENWGYLQCRLRSETNDILIERTFKFNSNNAKWAAHGCSDMVLSGLTGKSGSFSGRVAWVTVKQGQYQVEQSDKNLTAPIPLFSSAKPIVSLAWTPDAKSIYYIKQLSKDSYDIKRFDRISNTHHLVHHSKTPLNDLVWDASKSQLIFTKSVHGMQKLFKIENDLAKQLTFGKSIDVAPTVSNGKIVFVSDQNKTPMLFKYHSSGVKSYLPLEGDAMAMPMMYHHQLYWYDAKNGQIKVFDAIKKDTETFLSQSNVQALSPTPFGLLVAADNHLMLVNFDGEIIIRKPIQVNLLSSSWMDVT